MQNNPSPAAILEYVNDVLGFRFKYSKYPFAADSWEIEAAHILESWTSKTIVTLIRATLKGKPRWGVIGVSFGTQPAKPSVIPIGKIRPSRASALAVAEIRVRRDYAEIKRTKVVEEMAERILPKDEYAEFVLLLDDGVR